MKILLSFGNGCTIVTFGQYQQTKLRSRFQVIDFMAAQFKRPSPRRLIQVAFLSWMSMLGVDFLLHAGLLSSYYTRPSPFLLPPKEAFRLIPIGYLAFLLLTVLLMWLMVRLEVEGWRAGFVFGLKLGMLTWTAQDSSFATMLLHGSIEQMVIDILVKFETVKCQFREEPLGQGTISKLDTFEITLFGQTLLDAVAITSD